MVRVWGGMVVGIRGVMVEVEADVHAGGLPSFTIVGLPDAAVREARERVLTALRNVGLALPPRRVTVNLAPGHVHKSGASLDLPIAIGLCVAAGFLPQAAVGDVVVIGELSLSGAVKPVRGVLPLVMAARAAGRTHVIVAAGSAAQATLVPEMTVLPAQSLGQVVEHLRARDVIAPLAPASHRREASQETDTSLDLADVRGQQHARRALEVAAAGRHNLLFIGPPGAGKTLLASRLPTILPPLTRDEALDVTRIYSVVLSPERLDGLLVRRPFRAPHHTISDAGMIGGGPGPRPGELSLAHRGILFLDELPEFRRSVLEALRQPLEDKVVRVVRVNGAEEFPADLQLVAAMNPCVCGHLGDDRVPCRCSDTQIQHYRGRVSGPLLDRIDMCVHVPAVTSRELLDGEQGESSAAVRTRVLAAQQHARARGVVTASLPDESRALLRRALDRQALSARGASRVVRVARTIADLEHSPDIMPVHLGEALGYRPWA